MGVGRASGGGGRLARGAVVGLGAADAAAAELGVSRRQVYLLLGRWRAGEGVVSDLLPRRSSGGRGREHLPAEVEAVMRDVVQTRYLSRQRRSVAVVHREITRVCRTRGLRVPSRGTLVRRIAKLDPVAAVTAREGADAARPRRSAGGVPPVVEQLLEQVQIDHTVVDVMVVDERYRLPIGRPYVTGAIDVCSRCVVGLVVTLEAPSALSFNDRAGGRQLRTTPHMLSNLRRDLLRPKKIALPLIALQQHQQRQTALVSRGLRPRPRHLLARRREHLRQLSRRHRPRQPRVRRAINKGHQPPRPAQIM